VLKYVVTAVLIAFVWFLVAFFELDSLWGIIATALILVGLGVMLLVRRMRARSAAENIEKALGAQAEEQIKGVRPELQGEMRAIQSEFDKAVASLKTSKMGKGGTQALYALPWYMIIGPPGTGKSTALRQSGLQFPYLSASGGGLRGRKRLSISRKPNHSSRSSSSVV
jgi:type VI secretion system protein ImpL